MVLYFPKRKKKQKIIIIFNYKQKVVTLKSFLNYFWPTFTHFWITFESHLNQFKSNKKMIQKWFKNDSKVTQKRFKSDAQAIQKWFQILKLDRPNSKEIVCYLCFVSRCSIKHLLGLRDHFFALFVWKKCKKIDFILLNKL